MVDTHAASDVGDPIEQKLCRITLQLLLVKNDG